MPSSLPSVLYLLLLINCLQLSCATLTPPASAPFTATPTLTPAHVIAPSQNVGNTRNIDPITRLIITSSCVFFIPARFQLLWVLLL